MTPRAEPEAFRQGVCREIKLGQTKVTKRRVYRCHVDKLRNNSALRFKLIPEKDEDANENPDVKFILEASAEVFWL